MKIDGCRKDPPLNLIGHVFQQPRSFQLRARSACLVANSKCDLAQVLSCECRGRFPSIPACCSARFLGAFMARSSSSNSTDQTPAQVCHYSICHDNDHAIGLAHAAKASRCGWNLSKIVPCEQPRLLFSAAAIPTVSRPRFCQLSFSRLSNSDLREAWVGCRLPSAELPQTRAA